MNHDWLKKAGCRDHESLTPDAWSELNQYGYPNEIGMRALGVCLTQCTVALQCREYMAGFGVKTTIAGGGWFDNKGEFQEKLPGDMIDSIAIGAMFGITQAAIRYLVKQGVIPSAGRSTGGRHMFAVSEVMARRGRIINTIKGLAEWEKARKAEAIERAEKRASRPKGIRKATAERWEQEESLTLASAK